MKRRTEDTVEDTGPLDTASPGLRSSRTIFFAAPADDPRARRPVDAMVATVSWLLLVLFAWNVRAGSDLDERVIQLFDDGAPGWIRGIASVVYLFGGIYCIGLLFGIGAFARGRSAIARDMLLAAILAFAGLVALSYLAGPEFPDFFPEIIDEDTPSYPVTRLAFAVAIVRVAQRYLTVPMRNVGRRTLVLMTFSALVLSYGTLTGVIGGVLLGFASSATVHFVLGSGTGIPSRGRILAGLQHAGLDVDDVVFLPRQPTGASLVRAVRHDEDDLLVKVYGRDAADAALASRLWRTIWYRSETRPLLATNEQLAEHESLMLLTFERVGLPMLDLVGWSRAETDDMLVITRWVDGRLLEDVDAVELDDAVLDRVWHGLRKMHEAGITHGRIDRQGVVVTPDRLVLADVSGASLLADEDQVHADRAQMLVALALTVGVDRSVAAARRVLGDADLTVTLPFLQTPALTRGLQRDAKANGLDVDDLRATLAENLGADEPEMVQLQRVTWGNVAMVVLTVFAASTLISSLTELGLDTIADEISSAAWGWVAVAFVLAQLTNIGEYITLVGVMGRPVPFGPTMMFRYALSFISLAVPSEAGAIAMNIRYQQRLGVPPAAAVAQGPLLTIVSKGVDVILLLVTLSIVGSTFDLDEVDFGPVAKLVVAVVVIAVVAVAVVAAVPRLRARMLPHLKEGFAAVRGSLTDPERLMRVLGGTLMQKVLFAMTLSASVAAYGGSLSFTEAIFVNTAVSLFVGLVPIPGGIGIAETALAAGLVSVGVPEEAAVAAAITHRMVTSYIPPIFGWYASRWLTERRYL